MGVGKHVYVSGRWKDPTVGRLHNVAKIRLRILALEPTTTARKRIADESISSGSWSQALKYEKFLPSPGWRAVDIPSSPRRWASLFLLSVYMFSRRADTVTRHRHGLVLSEPTGPHPQLWNLVTCSSNPGALAIFVLIFSFLSSLLFLTSPPSDSLLWSIDKIFHKGWPRRYKGRHKDGTHANQPTHNQHRVFLFYRERSGSSNSEFFMQNSHDFSFPQAICLNILVQMARRPILSSGIAVPRTGTQMGLEFTHSEQSCANCDITRTCIPPHGEFGCAHPQSWQLLFSIWHSYRLRTHLLKTVITTHLKHYPRYRDCEH